MRVAKVTTNTYFTYHGSILNYAIHFNNVADVFLWDVDLIFPNARVAILTNCDKNFTHFALYPEYMPHIKNIYLDTHPDGSEIFSRFENTRFIISDKHCKLLENVSKKIKIIPSSEMENRLSVLKEEPQKLYYDDYLNSKHLRNDRIVNLTNQNNPTNFKNSKD